MFFESCMLQLHCYHSLHSALIWDDLASAGLDLTSYHNPRRSSRCAFSQNTTILAQPQAGTPHPGPWLGNEIRKYIPTQALLRAHSPSHTHPHTLTLVLYFRLCDVTVTENTRKPPEELQIYLRCKKPTLIQCETPALGVCEVIEAFQRPAFGESIEKSYSKFLNKV